MTLPANSIIIRPFAEDDRAFVEGSWVDSFKEGCVNWLTAPRIDKADYYAGQRRLIRILMERPTAEVRIAAAPESEETILGWAATEAPFGTALLHYVYVKTLFRGNGIAAALLCAAGFDMGRGVYTHITQRTKTYLEACAYGCRFDPWRLIGDGL